MNENIDLTKILKDCPKGTKLYSSLFGEVKFNRISYNRIIVECVGLHRFVVFNQGGKYLIEVSETNGTYFSSECLLFPSKEQRDWSKFTAPWLKKENTAPSIKKEKYDPKSLNPFDRVLVRDFKTCKWRCEHFSYFKEGNIHPYMASTSYKFCIPYNDDTKHLVGTTDEAPEYYKYWKD